MWEGIDKRRFPRSCCQCKIVVRKKGSSDQFTTHTENIGTGGVCVFLKKKLDLFTEVEVQLSLPDNSGSFISDGKIMWVVKEARSAKRFDTGIEFVGLSPEAKTRIARVVENILSGVYKMPKPAKA